MKEFRWDPVKSKMLKETRGVSFGELIKGEFITAGKHPKRDNQKILLFNYKGYVWVVPCVIEEDYIFLKTAFPSRKYTKNIKEVIKNEKD